MLNQYTRTNGNPSISIFACNLHNIPYMSKRSFHSKSLELGYYPTLSQMIRSSGFSIFKQKNKWKNIINGAYGKLVLGSFSFFFSSQSFLKNAWGRFVYEKNQGAECHGNDRIKLLQMPYGPLFTCPIAVSIRRH